MLHTFLQLPFKPAVNWSLMLKKWVLGGAALHQVNLTLTTAAESVWKHWLISRRDPKKRAQLACW